ncbi:MAG: DUF1513 domain-containing protein [Pseudomonadota bacterium]
MTKLDRRGFLAGSGFATMALGAGQSWASVGSPSFITAAKEADGYRLFGLGSEGDLKFGLRLPDRGHAAAVHPLRTEAVAFARRPGYFALVLDCARGLIEAELTAPLGRHFYGHGCYSADARHLFTTESAYESGEGLIGVWDVRAGYRRIGEISSGGIGPHDVMLMPDGERLVVANGGIRTHPATGREKLNLETMTPNLSYLRVHDGRLLETVGPPNYLRRNSIRHLSVSRQGEVAVAFQWQGEADDGVPVLGFHRQGDSALRIAEADPIELAAMLGYAGSISYDGSETRIAISSPRGGRVMAWDLEGNLLGTWHRTDVCGIAASANGWMATDGLGGVTMLTSELLPTTASRYQTAFDNHLIQL